VFGNLLFILGDSTSSKGLQAEIRKVKKIEGCDVCERKLSESLGPEHTRYVNKGPESE
jgi:hypothetical protein